MQRPIGSVVFLLVVHSLLANKHLLEYVTPLLQNADPQKMISSRQNTLGPESAHAKQHKQQHQQQHQQHQQEHQQQREQQQQQQQEQEQQ